MNRTLYVFEFADEVEAFLSTRPADVLRAKDAAVLAILPEAQAALKRLGVPFSDTYAFFDKDSHQRALLKSDELYRHCLPLLRLEDEAGARRGYDIAFMTHARLFAHYLLWLIEIIHNACGLLKAERIVCCTRENGRPAEPCLDSREGHAGEIAARVARSLGLPCQTAGAIPLQAGGRHATFSQTLGEVLKTVLFQANLRLLPGWYSDRKTILAPDKAYNLGRVLAGFKSAFPGTEVLYLGEKDKSSVKRLLLWNGRRDALLSLPSLVSPKKRSAFRRRLTEAAARLARPAAEGEPFRFKGVDFQDLLLGKVTAGISPSLMRLHGQTANLDDLLRAHRPTLVVSQMARYLYCNLAELARKYDIPSVLISHGSHVPPRNEYEMIEWREHSLGLMDTPYSHIAIQSPWAQKQAERFSTPSQRILTGPLLFAQADPARRHELRQQLLPSGAQDKIVLLHADTPRQRMVMRLFVYQTVDEYLHSLNALIRAVDASPRYHLLIRFRPLHFLSKADIEPLLEKSGNCSVSAEGTFEEALAAADMLASYSSTTIEEALQNRIPVLQYDPQGKYCHVPGQTLSPDSKPELDSCYYVDGEKKLPWALDWLAQNHFGGNSIPAQKWDRHVFREDEKTSLPEYFKGLFTETKGR